MEENSSPIRETSNLDDSVQNTKPTSDIKNSLLLFLSFLVIVSSLLAGFFAYQTQQLTKRITELQSVKSSPTPIATPQATTIATPTSTPIQKACTLEAKLCSDGSSVGRSGPNCEFAPCPTP